MSHDAARLFFSPSWVACTTIRQRWPVEAFDQHVVERREDHVRPELLSPIRLQPVTRQHRPLKSRSISLDEAFVRSLCQCGPTFSGLTAAQGDLPVAGGRDARRTTKERPAGWGLVCVRNNTPCGTGFPN